MSPTASNLTSIPSLSYFGGLNWEHLFLDSVFTVNMVAALWIQYWLVMLQSVQIGEKVLSQFPRLRGLVDWRARGLVAIDWIDGVVRDTALAGPCDWFKLKACESISPDIFNKFDNVVLTSENVKSDEREIRKLFVTPLQPHQRAVQVGVSNPVQHGQSFDCHDYGNNSVTGAKYSDILPAVEVIDSFPVNSKCVALPAGCFLQSCHGTAGIFLCNRSVEKVTIDCSYLGKIAREIFTNYISRHQDQIVRLDFCRRKYPPVDASGCPLIDGPKGQEYTGNSFRKKEFATEGGDDMWSLQINRTQSCYEHQEAPRDFEDGLIQLGVWDALIYND